MSQVTRPILLDETGKEIAGVLRQQNALLSAMARESVNALAASWKDIHNIVREGLAAEIFHVGDQLIIPWKDVAADKEYNVPLDIVHFGDATLKDGSVVPAMFLQWHYSIPFDMQFDHQENEQASESTFSSDYFYYEAYDGDETRYKLLEEGSDYVVDDTIPTSKVYYHSSIKDPTGHIVKNGYNRWSHSALRQFLNSSGGKGEWWTAQHLGDVAPDQHTSKAGFMSGFDDDLLACLKPIKVTTALNSVTDTELGVTEDTYDTFFLPSLEQIYAKPLLAGAEGGAFDYWKLAVGKPQPQELGKNNTNPAYLTYALDADTSVQRIFLRSAYRNSSYGLYIIYHTGGYVDGGYAASNARRCTPVCAIC